MQGVKGKDTLAHGLPTAAFATIAVGMDDSLERMDVSMFTRTDEPAIQRYIAA